MFSKSISSVLVSTLFAAGAASAAASAPLTLEVFNPGEEAIFPVASVLVAGKHDAVLIDAQFSRAEAQKLVEKIRASGKKLTTVYISHSDPDFYFGLDVIKAAFPKAKIVATPETVAEIRRKADAKVAYWGPILKDNAPKSIVIPEALTGKRIALEGQSLDIAGPTPARTYVWIPSIKAVVGGVVLFGNLHVWMADTQSAQSRQDWLKTLDGIAALNPVTVVPGHFKVGSPLTPDSISYTRDYVVTFEAETAKAANSAALIEAMKMRYPKAGLEGALETSAKVAKGEMKW
ncbi:Glyoxylase, beta-lactamase superfamily II [Janthinobacterium sp. OK676]|uniref:MBL fold metallo-hydrolase n=1 Tax=unclassified Janthinobacterium TaxID=2610881 RepID=UPI000882B0D0|nr:MULTISPECIES: MBL fold metallo-hydrolase [unclassified Janthinobacterium]PJJ21196.1 glyoxylase-like metal-dependent hydrolase (beta-lactamase superfamily II) [Janthinobacterium sp. 67]SDN65564.1 Glyoxylase, beta-lactamase superfamily II [Janthinobacterium sp. OK676]